MSRPQGRRLPAELLVAIADHLCRHQDIITFGLTCKDLYNLLVKKQRRSLEIDFDGSPNACTSLATPTYVLLNQRAALLTLFSDGDRIEHLQDELGSCRCCLLTKKIIAANHTFQQNDCELANSIKKLTLSGYFPYRVASGCSLTSHPFIRSGGFKAIRPEAFDVDLGWADWRFDVLHGMSVTNLKVLKLPISLSSDCVRLGQALTVMPRLASLAITDIPDREEFLDGLEYIGKGIMSCASTLRELDIEMTNFNRPASWYRDERFVEPEDDGFFFRKLFPCPPKEELFALCERHFRHGTDPMVEAPLSLMKLRLKHVSLPWYSFGIIFNAITIKHLHLPYSMVDGKLWGLLETHAHLEALTEISYDMLSTGFLKFLGEQSSIKELTFARPQDLYDAAEITFYGDKPHMTFRISKEAPRLGTDVGAKYPSLDHFLSSLEDMTMLRHLVLPADMYTITPGCLSFIAASLTSLEHLELAFDYNDPELQRMFASCFLCGPPTLKRITFFSLMQPRPLLDFNSAHFHGFIVSLGHKIPANLKLVRYMLLNQVNNYTYRHIEVYYHRETPVDGEWWLRLPHNERDKTFAEGGTPRIVPMGKWDWEPKWKELRNGQDWKSGLSRSQEGKSR